MVTSRPSRIHVILNATITSQCQRLNGSRSILAGTWLSTVCVTAPPSLKLTTSSHNHPSRRTDRLRGCHGFRPPPRSVSAFFNTTPPAPPHVTHHCELTPV